MPKADRFRRPAPRLMSAVGMLIGALLLLVVAVLAAFRAAAQVRERQSRAEAAPAGGRFVRGGDLEIFVQESGPADGPPVLLVHGTGAGGDIWRETVVALAGAGYRAIAIDLPPFGFSERPRPPRYTDAAQADRILGVLDHLGIEGVILAGHSFGARPTVEAALRDPGRVRLLVLVDAALGIDPAATSPTEPPLPIRAVLAIPLLRDALVASTLTNPLLTRSLLRQLILDPADANDLQVGMVQRQFPVRGTTAALGEWLREFLTSQERTLSGDRARYATLTMPALLAWGERDRITPVSQGRDLQGLLPAGKLVILPGTGHIPAIEDAPGFNRVLVEFLEQHRSEPR